MGEDVGNSGYSVLPNGGDRFKDLTSGSGWAAGMNKSEGGGAVHIVGQKVSREEVTMSGNKVGRKCSDRQRGLSTPLARSSNLSKNFVDARMKAL